ncbi:MAG TPA: hypothetical protein VFK89_02580 [Actinomycetota bacterium]|nr:hypothetical protein [Actinomycetota bacterium]
MSEITRRDFLAMGGKTVVAGGLILTIPKALYDPRWRGAAAALAPSDVQATFTALVEAVTTVADEKAAAWIIAEFDKALPPLPEGSPSSAVAAVLDSYTVKGGYGATFSSADPDARRSVLGDMVKDPTPDIRQIANQILPFASFTHWSDATLDAPATVGGPRLPQWDEVAWPGPAHSYLDTYRDGGPHRFHPK